MKEMSNRLVHQVAMWTEAGIKVYAFRPPTTKEILKLGNNIVS